MTYNYEIRHVKGEANCIADCLSRRPEWVLAKKRQSDSQGGAGDGAKGPRDELCLRVFTESWHFLRDNPALRKLEEIGKKDTDYVTMIDHIRAGRSFRDLPTSSEGARMEGEWPKLSVLEEVDIIVLKESDSVSKIFSSQSY